MAILIVLAREFESRRGEILNLFAQKRINGSWWERLAWVSTAVRRKSTREKNWNILEFQKKKKSLLCDPGSELRLRGRKKNKGKDNKWDGKKKEVIVDSSISRVLRGDTLWG